jgi:hypothetical protein
MLRVGGVRPKVTKRRLISNYTIAFVFSISILRYLCVCISVFILINTVTDVEGVLCHAEQCDFLRIPAPRRRYLKF